jgi:class 3 adenylate cyclase
MRNLPDTRYTQVDRFAIAYQVVGNGPIDLLYLPQFVSNVEWNWLVPEHARFMDRLSSFARLIVMDPRGHGCSDRLTPGEAPTLEGMVDDVLGVAGAAASFRGALFGGGRSAFVAMLAAAAHPDRFDRLILFGASPTWMRTDDLPWEESEEEWEQDLEMYRRLPSGAEWAESWIRSFAPSLLAVDGAVRSFASYGANTRAPGGGLWMDEVFRGVDLRALLPTIRVPTLILHRSDDPLEPIESGRYLADRIPGATLVELDGRDSLPWIGNAGAVVDEIEIFLTGERRPPEAERALATVLFTDIVDSTKRGSDVGDHAWSAVRGRHDEIVRSNLARFRGREIKTLGDGFLATFDGPVRGVECARAIAAEVPALGIEIRAGLHAGEVALEGADVAGVAVAIGARVAALAGPSEVFVSQTVKDLVAGSGLAFEDAGEHELKGVPDRWQLYRVVG